MTTNIVVTPEIVDEYLASVLQDVLSFLTFTLKEKIFVRINLTKCPSFTIIILYTTTVVRVL